MNIRDAAINCEVRKIAYRQTKDGVVVSFVLHPNDVPPSLANAQLGTRYMLALVEIGDDEQPKGGAGNAQMNNETPRQETKTGGARSWDSMTAAQQAGILCADKAFQRFLTERNDSVNEYTEAEAVNYIYENCGVASRRELDGGRAKEHWQIIVADYRFWQQHPELVG
jgi:hypothetical protein